MELKPGVKGTKRVTVAREMLASAIGSGMIDVFSTPYMVALMESAAQTSVSELVGDGNVTVGTKLEISHLAATPLGMDAWAESELLEVDGRRLVFRVSAYDDCGLIGEGMHERFIVGAEKFVAKCNAKLEKKN